MVEAKDILGFASGTMRSMIFVFASMHAYVPAWRVAWPREARQAWVGGGGGAEGLCLGSNADRWLQSLVHIWWPCPVAFSLLRCLMPR